MSKPAPIGTDADTCSASLPEPGWTVERGLKNLLSPPEWDEDHTVMVWMENSGDDDAKVLSWAPETPQEWAEAESFYAACHARSWQTFAELLARPREPGEWLLRWRAVNTKMYVATLTDEELAEPFDPRWTDRFLTADPKEAAIMSHDRAITLVPQLSARFELDEGDDVYFEAVKRDEAITDFEKLSGTNYGTAVQ
jgi:hypothetical protein